MGEEMTSWERAVQFHGHVCMGLATGLKVAEAALEAFGGQRDVDEQMVAIVENDSCAVDAIQLLTGCTLGKGNLILRDYGKQAYTFALREKQSAIRITLRKTADGEQRDEILRLREKVASDDASEIDKSMLKEKSQQMLEDYLARPAREICEVKEVAYDVPERARIFASVECAECGERVMEPRSRLKDGKIVCLPCAEHYTRGWSYS